MSQFFGGALDPTWPHFWLIAGCIIGGALVGLGVILEAEKIFSLPVLAVVVGVILEAACTLLLFGFDEGISQSQQRTISTQQQRIDQLLTPRRLSPAQKARIAAAIAPYRLNFRIMFSQDAESWDFAMDIAAALQADGWIWRPYPGGVQPLEGVRPAAGVTIADHTEIQGTPEQERIVNALVSAMREPDRIGMTDVRPKIDSRIPMITIITGTKW